MELSVDDRKWLKRTDEYRQSFENSKPLHSDFVVSSTVVYRVLATGEEKFKNGTNDEPCWIAGSICAERCALVSMRAEGLNESNILVKAIYITSDSPIPISPGVLCREFMASCRIMNEDTFVVLGNNDLTQTSKQKLPYYYPFPFIFYKMSRKETYVAQANLKLPTWPEDAKESYRNCYQKALNLAREMFSNEESEDKRRLSCASCVIFDDGTFDTALEKRGLEYGTSLDAVCLLTEYITSKKRSGVQPIVLCQVDSYGFANAPYASARAFLTEYGFDDVGIICHCLPGDEVVLNFIKASDLMPRKLKFK